MPDGVHVRTTGLEVIIAAMNPAALHLKDAAG